MGGCAPSDPAETGEADAAETGRAPAASITVIESVQRLLLRGRPPLEPRARRIIGRPLRVSACGTGDRPSHPAVLTLGSWFVTSVVTQPPRGVKRITQSSAAMRPTPPQNSRFVPFSRDYRPRSWPSPSLLRSHPRSGRPVRRASAEWLLTTPAIDRVRPMQLWPGSSPITSVRSSTSAREPADCPACSSIGLIVSWPSSPTTECAGCWR